MIKRLFTYLSDVKIEMSKVTWPTRTELVGSTRLVLILSLILAILVFITDRFLSMLLDAII